MLLPYPTIKDERGISIVELLVVVFITIILLSTLFMLLKPNEYRARARDQARLSDVATLERAILEYQHDNNAFPGHESTLLVSYAVPLDSVSPAENPLGGWIGGDFSAYLVKLPIDPINNTSYYYSYIFSGSAYEINARLELELDHLTSDGGDAVNVYEVGTDLTLL